MIRREAIVDGMSTRVQSDTVKATLQMTDPVGYTHVILTKEEAGRLKYGQHVFLYLVDEAQDKLLCVRDGK